MKDMDSDYSVEIDQIDKSHWHALLPEFDDATWYQTWSYGEKFWGPKNMSHASLRYGGRIVAMAQLRILRFPRMRMGVAYVNWGPLWRRGHEPENRVHLRNMLRGLHNEYVLTRHLVLRVSPKIYDMDENKGIREIFLEEGYVFSPDPLKTFIVDLRPPLEVIRQLISKDWKTSLKFAEKQGLEICEAKDPEHFAIVAALGKEMKDRKKFIGGDYMAALEANLDLPQGLRLKIMLCSQNGEPVSALGWSAIGKVSFPLLGGTGNRALRSKASFLLFWRMIQFSKENGFVFCDTAGVHKKRNPGNYHFKKGVAGKHAQEIGYLGQFDAYKSRFSFFLFNKAVAIRESILNGARLAKSRLR